MNQITLELMTLELCKTYYQGFIRDPNIYMDMHDFTPFIYTDKWVEAYYNKQITLKRIYFAILFNNYPCGEILIKNIDKIKKECTLSIHLQCDKYKNQGIGSFAEKLAVEYAINNLQMETVLADVVLKNKISQHVLEKNGFKEIRKDKIFIYYKFTK